jgi:hypothetical protein
MRKFIGLKVTKWRLLASIILAILLGGVGMRFLTSTAPLPSSTLAPPLSSLNNDVKEETVQTPSSDMSEAAVAMKVYRDPKTGRFKKPPGGTTGEGALPADLSYSTNQEPPAAVRELTELMSPMAGGGIITNVRLRFRRPLVATREADGSLTIQHAPGPGDTDEGR